MVFQSNSLLLIADVLIEAHRYELEEQIKPLINDLRSTIPKHLRHYEMYYQKLIAATITRSGMGPTNEFPIIKQTEGVYKSKSKHS